MGASLPNDTLRPSALDSFIGQSKLKKVLEISINGAKARNEPLGHILFNGPPGLGKTTLAYIIARATNSRLIIASATSVTKIPSLATLLNQIDGEGGAVVFIDEIHRLPRMVEEALYSVMEDFRLDVTTEKFHFNLKLPRFTLVGATTRQGMITKPMRDRFLQHYDLDWYTLEELAQIIKRSAAIVHVEVEDRAAEEIAKRAKRTPRIANNLLLSSRDFALSYDIHQINYAVVLGMMEMREIDEIGLTAKDRQILETIIKRFHSGPVGLETLAAVLVEEVDVLERIHEPYLLQCGLIERTARGRIVTQKGIDHMKVYPEPKGLSVKDL